MHRLFLLLAAFSLLAACRGTAQNPVATDTLSAPSDTLSATADTLPASPAQVFKDTLTLAMVGDLMLGTTYPANALPQEDGARLFEDCAALLRDADIAVGNFEGAMLEGGKCRKAPGPNTYAFRMPPRYAKYLQDAGFDYLGMANNHALDFHEEGLFASMKALDDAGIANSGHARERKTALIEREGLRIGFISFSRDAYALSSLDMDVVSREVAALRAQCDLLICGVHGGAEGRKYVHLPEGTEHFLGENRGDMRKICRTAIDAGADVVFCHGPHVPRCVDLYRDRFIAFSLGNFCTPTGMSLAGETGYAPLIEIRLTRDGRFVDGQIHSFIQTKFVGPRRDANGSAARLIQRLTREDVPQSPLTVDDDGAIRRK